MKSFPMFIRTTGRRVVIAGGGEQAAQKARLMLKTDAAIVVAAPEIDAELSDIVASGRAIWHGEAIGPELFQGAAMSFVASGCPGADAALHAMARAARCPVNVVDRPELCDITTPSLVDRDPVVVAIGTEGNAPVLARQIKTRIEELLPHNIGGLASFAGRMRASVAERVARHKRRDFWRWVFRETPRAAWTSGAEREAAALIKSAIQAGGAPDCGASGMLSVIDARAGEQDLLTLRAVQRLQEADVIYHDRASDAPMLELARRDAERVCLADLPSGHDARILGVARAGRRVAWLCSCTETDLDSRARALFAGCDSAIVFEFIPGPGATRRSIMAPMPLPDLTGV